MGKIEDVFAANLREALVEADMSARTLARKVADIETVTVGKKIIPPTSLITKYMQGEVYPRPERVRSIAKALGKDELELITPKPEKRTIHHVHTSNSADDATRRYIVRVVGKANRLELNALKAVCKIIDVENN